MAENTKIEWCDHSASPWHGCAEVHTGCDNCYARTMAKRNPGTLGVWGSDGTRVMSASFTKNCRRWNKSAQDRGVIETVFPSICDPFEDWKGPILDHEGGVLLKHVGAKYYMADYCEAYHKDGQGWFPITMDDLRRDLFDLIDECQSLRFLLLTKRPENVRRMWLFTGDTKTFDTSGDLMPDRPNVCLLASVSDQATANAMIPPLLKCRDLVPVLGVSAEPLLGPVNLDPWLEWGNAGPPWLDWTIVGGESGHDARLCEIGWIRSIRDQCKSSGTVCFVKQLGNRIGIRNDSYSEWPRPDDLRLVSSDRQRFQGDTDIVQAIDGKGGNWDEWPEDLRIREYPKGITLPPSTPSSSPAAAADGWPDREGY